MNQTKAKQTSIGSERGMTLIEILVVLAVVAAGALVTVTNLSATYHKFELDSSSKEVAAFLNQAPKLAKESNQDVLLIWDPEDAQVRITDATGANLLDVLDLPDFIVVEPAGAQTYRCDTMGRAYIGAASVTMMDAVQQLSATHRDIASGDITPFIAYQYRLTPLWNVTVEKVLL